jgi:hypothetical protein
MNPIHYLLMLDVSKSMSPHEVQVKKGLLEHFKKLIQYRENQSPPSTGSFHLGFFNDLVYPIEEIKKINSLELTLQSMEFNGQTALYDAMGKGIDYLKSLNRKGTMLLIIFTDGHENGSKEYSENQINTMLLSDSLKAYLVGAGWNVDCDIQKFPVYGMIIHQTKSVNMKEIFALMSEIYKNLGNYLNVTHYP